MLETIAEKAPPARNLTSSNAAPPDAPSKGAGIARPIGEALPGASAE
jgi:hypothetical protein